MIFSHGYLDKLEVGRFMNGGKVLLGRNMAQFIQDNNLVVAVVLD